jgi:hypothetical protein
MVGGLHARRFAVDYPETYARLTTAQLLELARDQQDLTDDARQALADELRRRGVAVEDEPETGAQPEAETEAPEAWWKRDLWMRLFLWIVVAAACNILSLIIVGTGYFDLNLNSTPEFVLVAVLGCAVSEALPERWRRLRTNTLLAVAVLLAWSAVWILRR